MEDAKRRWRVTYTKHIKQKRKVYQDGFLDLYVSSSKVKLYDDCEKLLECRFLKNEEVVRCGETLAFNSYFVDVGDPEGDDEVSHEFNEQEGDKKCREQLILPRRQRFVNRSFSPDQKNFGDKKAQRNCISPLRKIILEFKKKELERYGSPESNSDTVAAKTSEWRVLYTAQLTQKAKKFHDGFLRLKICGLQGRQVLLYDETRKLLDSRFLRRDEVINSNESIRLDGHLVEIGEVEESHEPPADLKTQKNFSTTVKLEAVDGQQNYVKTNKHGGKEFRGSDVSGYGIPQRNSDTKNTTTKEWQVMYTTQVTQKAKKYHDGVLKLAYTGSFQRQVLLYDDDKRLLSSRFLKKDEMISSGEMFSFGGHLVDIGEPLDDHELQSDVNLEGISINVKNKVTVHGRQMGLKADKSAIGKSQRNTFSSKKADSTSSFCKASEIVPTDNPMRNASQILSILQRPMNVTSINAGCSDKSKMEQLPCVKLEEPHEDKKTCENLNVGRLNENTAIKNRPDLLSSVASSTCNGSHRFKDTELGDFVLCQVEVKTDNEEALVFSRSNSITSASNILGGNGRNCSKNNTAMETEDFPSFDLGL